MYCVEPVPSILREKARILELQKKKKKSNMPITMFSIRNRENTLFFPPFYRVRTQKERYLKKKKEKKVASMS